MFTGMNLSRCLPGIAAQTTQLMKMIMIIASTVLTMIQKTPMLTCWPVMLSSIVKLPGEERRSNSPMLQNDNSLSNNTRARRKQNCVKTTRCMETASMGTLALMPMVFINYRRRPICQVTSWLSSALNSIETVPVCMARDVNSCTVFMISKLSWPISKPLRKVADSPSKGTTRSVAIHMLNAYGLTWKLAMAVVHQRNQDLPASSKFITRINSRRTWDKRKQKSVLQGTNILEVKCKWITINSSNSHSWWNNIPIIIIWTKIIQMWISDIICINRSINTKWASIKVSHGTINHVQTSGDNLYNLIKRYETIVWISHLDIEKISVQ